MARRPGRGAGRTVMVALAVVAAGVALNVGFGSAGAQQEGDRALVERGRQLYGAECALCHGEGGRGVPDRGPSLIGAGAASVDFMLRTGRMPLDSPDARMRRGAPAFPPEQIDALVAYTATFPGGGPPIPEVDPARGELGRGRQVFIAQCAACHGPTGAGIAVGQRDVSSSLGVAEPVEIAEAVRTGPGVMPVFSKETLTEHDLDSVIAWIQNLEQRESRGGISVGRSGPVTEGFVAWLVGMGLLAVVIYLLGEKETRAGPGGPGARAGDGGSAPPSGPAREAGPTPGDDPRGDAGGQGGDHR